MPHRVRDTIAFGAGNNTHLSLIQPDVLEAGVVVDAVVVHRKTLDVRLPAGSAPVVLDDRARRVIDQQLLSIPHRSSALVAVGLPGLREAQPVDFRIAIFAEIPGRLANADL